jgi:plastocyanin
VTSRISRRALIAGLAAVPALLKADAGLRPLQTRGGGGVPAAARVPDAVVRVSLAFPRGQYYFDPVGVWVPKGGTVRWQFPFSGGVGALMGVSVTAFHPDNENHELRIPEAALPFNSGSMNRHADGFISFEQRFDVEGTYDYFSLTHEVLGMVGRLVVGRPGGPAEKAPGYGARDGRAPMYPASATLLNAIPAQEIVTSKTLPYPRDLIVRPYPYGQR